MSMTTAIKVGLTTLHHYLADRSRPWESKIGHIIPRAPHAETLGDASQLGGGAFSHDLEFWFEIEWSDRVRNGTQLSSKHPDFVHINSLEFIIIILQMCATIVRFETMEPADQHRLFPNGMPELPVICCWTDNMSSRSWANSATAKSSAGQRLVGAFAELLRTRNLGINCEHIPGIQNVLSDFISRPTHYKFSPPQRAEQVFRTHASLRTYTYFHPSPGLLHVLSSLLFSKDLLVLPSLPKCLGHFGPVGSTTSSIASL